MGRMINLSIDLTKIDKTKIVAGKTGQKYYDITVSVNDTADNYNNDVSCWNKQTKEQVEAKEAKVYLGNGRTFYRSGVDARQPAAQAPPQATKPVGNNQPNTSEEDDLPF